MTHPGQGMKCAPLRWAALAVAVALVLPTGSLAQDVAGGLRAEIQRRRTALDAIPGSPLVDGDRPRLRALLDDAESQLKQGRTLAALESLSSACPGVQALASAGSGWDDTGKGAGKHLDALAKEWEEAGRRLKADRPKFPTNPPKGESAFVRALAEQSMGQIDEHYAVAQDYGRESGVSAGAYYLGRAEGQLAWALTLSRLPGDSEKPALRLTSLKAPLATLEDDIVEAYAKPGSTAQHTNFILANSSLKLAKELEQHELRFGALLTLLRSLFALSLATLPTPTADQDAGLAEAATEFEKRFSASKRDESIGAAHVEKARISLEKARAGGEPGERERLRAAALLRVVVPRYLEITEGMKP